MPVGGHRDHAVGAGLNLFLGSNGQGKTNLLESIYYFRAGRSFRAQTDAELVRFGAAFCRVELECSFDDTRRERFAFAIELRNAHSTKTIKIDGDVLPRRSDLAGRFPVVLFGPNDLRTVSGEPEHRRRFFDMIGVMIDPGYRRSSPTSRLDSFVTPSAYQFVELNAESPAGIAYAEVLMDIFLELPLVQRFQERWSLKRFQARERLLQTLLECYREGGGREEHPVIAIVDYEDVPTRTEHHMFRDFFEERGYPAFKLHTWLLGSADAGNMTVAAPASATLGQSGTVTLSFSGLTAGVKYLGSVAYGGVSGMPNPTIVRVDP